MSLILTRDLDGKGNCNAAGVSVPLQKVVRGDGTTALVATGGTHLKLATGKADGLVFAPWEIVKCGSSRQEDAILRHCEKQWGVGKSPIVRMDWGNRTIADEWRRRHADQDEVIAVNAAVAGGDIGEITAAVRALMASSSNAPDREARKIPQHADIDTAPKRDMSSMPSQARTKAGVEDSAEVDARHKQYADGVYQQEYDRHRADGKSETQAASYAERSRAAALRKGAPEEPAQAAG